MKTGAQLYTVRAYTQTESDFALTMSKIAKIGYKTVQISAIGSIRPEPWLHARKRPHKGMASPMYA